MGQGREAQGLGSVLDVVSFKYYGVSADEIYERIFISTAYVITLPVLDTVES